MVTLTAREACFAEYLEQEGHRYRHEPDVGGRKPDFVVELPTGARAAFEVFEPAVEKPANTVGSIDSYGAIRRGVDKRKYEQAKAARRVGMPFVLVVVPTRMGLTPDAEIVAGAMFGDLTVTFRLDPLEPSGVDGGSLRFGANARLQLTQQRAISAAALLRWFNPTSWRVRAAARARTRLDRHKRPGRCGAFGRDPEGREGLR